MAKLIGNHGWYTRRQGNGPGGVGVQNLGPVIGSWEQATGQVGEVLPVTINQVAYQPLRVGIYVQASAAVSIRYSLDNIALAGSEDPVVRANATWTAPQTLAAGEIVKTTADVFTVAEITFTAAGVVSFHAR